jgi:hypothetical protein
MKKLNIMDPEIIRLIMILSNEILEIVDNQGKFTRGDLQGVIEAKVMKILRAGLELS